MKIDLASPIQPCIVHLSPQKTKNRKNEKMKMTLTTYQIADMLATDENANWSYKGAFALAEYLEEFEESTGEEMEFDAVAIRCDFSEYASLQEWASEYSRTSQEEEDDDEIDEKIRQHIQDHGHLIEFDGGIIVSSF